MKKEFNEVYFVQPGDNIDIIAKKYNISPIRLLILNAVTPDMIKKGTYLIIK